MTNYQAFSNVPRWLSAAARVTAIAGAAAAFVVSWATAGPGNGVLLAPSADLARVELPKVVIVAHRRPASGLAVASGDTAPCENNKTLTATAFESFESAGNLRQ